MPCGADVWIRWAESPSGIGFILVCFGLFVARVVLPGLVTLSSRGIRKQYGNGPIPAQVFGIVWTILYILLAFSACLYASAGFCVTKTGFYEELVDGTNDFYKGRSDASAYYLTGWIMLFVEWFLNVTWTTVFFGMRQRALGTAMIVVMIPVVITECVMLWLAYWLAGALVLPYILWLFVALYLAATFQESGGAESSMASKSLNTSSDQRLHPRHSRSRDREARWNR